MHKQHKWAPDTAVCRAKQECLFYKDEMFCTTTLYNYIDAQLLEVKNLDLAEKTKRNTKHHVSRKNKRVLGRSIEEQPEAINNREDFGHFEIDTVVGKRKGSESVVLTLTERKTRFEILRLIDAKDADSVAYALQGILSEFGSVIKSITADNGTEFIGLETCVADHNVDIYFTHPDTSSERGTNEVHNKMVRRSLPKHVSLDTTSPRFVDSVAFEMNILPRKMFNYRTPQEMFKQAVLTN